MHVAGRVGVRGRCARLRRGDRGDRVAASRRPPLSAAARVRPAAPGTAGVGGRSSLQGALPRQTHRPPAARRRRRSQAARRARVLPGARPQPTALGAVAGRRTGGRPVCAAIQNPSRSSRRGIGRGHRDRAVRRVARAAAGGVARARVGRAAAAELGPVAGRRAARACHRPWRDRARRPGDAPRPAGGGGTGGPGPRERRRGGLDRPEARAVRARSMSASARTGASPGSGPTWGSSRRSRTRSAGRSTTSCSPWWPVPSAATCGFTARRPMHSG